MSAPRKHWHFECVTSEARDIRVEAVTSWHNGDLERAIIPIQPTARLLWMLLKAWIIGTPAIFDFKVTVTREEA